MGSIAGANVCFEEAASCLEDVDSDLLQEQTQSICEELQKRGASTTLALARHLGFEKSSAINPLMFLLLGKNVVVRVSDIPPIWSLSPTFPMSPHFGSSPFSLSSQPPPPLGLGFFPSVSRAASSYQCTPIPLAPVPVPSSVPAVVTPAPGPTATPTAVSSPAPSPALVAILTVTESQVPAPSPVQTPISVPPPAIPASAPVASLPSPALSPAPIPNSTPASVIPAPALIATPTVTPSPAPTNITTPVAGTPAPTPISTPVTTTPDPSQVLAPEFVVSRTALTFLEHVIPVPVEDFEGEVENRNAVAKISPETPLPALTFIEHLIPEEKKVSVGMDHSPQIKPRLPVPALTFKEHVIPTCSPPRTVVYKHKEDQHRQNRSRRRKQDNVQSYPRFQRPVKRKYEGSDTSLTGEKTGDNLTELQVRILHKLRETGPIKTIDLSKRLGLVTSSDVNPLLYDLQDKNLVVKISDMPGVWQLCEPALHGAEPEEQRCSDSDESW